MPDRRVVYLPLDRLTTPSDGAEVVMNNWWVIDPEQGAIFWKNGSHYAPQCNKNRAVTELITPKIWPTAEIRLIETAYIPAHMSD